MISRRRILSVAALGAGAGLILPGRQRLGAQTVAKRCHWGTDLTLSFARATWRQRLTHITEELKFLSETDKDWIVGRSILQRLNWT
jgi:L-fuconolactonase